MAPPIASRRLDAPMTAIDFGLKSATRVWGTVSL
jgi:hypothetical protein